MMSKLDDLMTMDALARAVHMNRRTVRDLCVKSNIAIRWGKNGVRAKLSELEDVILSCRVGKPKSSDRPAHHRPSSSRNLHPDVNC